MTFTYQVQPGDWAGVAPLVVLAVLALVVMLVDLLLPHAGARSKHTGPANFAVLPIVALLGVVGAIVATSILFAYGPQKQVFNHMISADSGTLVAYLIILSAGLLGILLSPAYLKRLGVVHQGEYYALLLFAILGMMLLAGSTSFLTVFIGLEMFSLALYILCSFIEQRKASQEAGMKYFLLSSFASAFLLYGIALIYAATGSTTFNGVSQFVTKFVQDNHTHYIVTLTSSPTPVLLLVALGLLSVGFAFKVSAVPFQAWTPDVYQGAPAPVTAFMSVGTKVAALIAFVRIFGFVLLPIQSDWMPVIEALSILTIIAGNLMALAQSNIKRMLAYSSIAHGGYLLIGVVVGGTQGATAILLYLASYLFMNIGAFGVISVLERLDNSGYEADELRGLWYRRPVLAGLLAFFLLSLAGFPPMAGFWGKYYIFYTALVGGHPELLIIGIVASILGIYYYLRFTATMFMEPGDVVESGELARISVPAPLPTRTSRGTTSATAVAERPAETKVVATNPAGEKVVVETPAGKLVGFTWLGLGLAALGTLTAGIVLALWFSSLQQAAQLLFK
ncbi:NADH-quinone oxidoreductase subunit N [Tengunoibacter tsumagoiensis]|uniref:NADH-quinone oxidoreductase subunit N n=1 Tax=Tengunoibacter tsumagoiensis TaxID=2014871 RepID=A0A401ZV69_9CHLR|nr:NADH-quinone oxidoreductase subunit N [Tengunoibacter tsumagoiensis]GCE10737.1 hypothetical protein KTT_05960 [Tengunoibacter tsumagoiensis]